MAQIKANDIRPGNVLKIRDALWIVVKTQHVKPGKGGAFVQVESKKVIDGTKLNERLRSTETVDRVRLEQRDYQFLYRQDDQLVFMDNENYEQIEISADLIGERIVLLQDGMEIRIESYEGKPLNIALPEHIVLAVDTTEPVVKGQTAAASYKPAVLTNGLRVMVPPFVSQGDNIVIDSNELSYVRRAD